MLLNKTQIIVVVLFLFTSLPAENISAQDSLKLKISNLLNLVSEDKLTETIDWLQQPADFNSRVNFTPGNDSAAAYIYRKLKQIPGLTSVELDTFYIEEAEPPYNTYPLVNVVATLEGNLYPDQYYLLGAHLDASASNMDGWDSLWQTIDAPGADDNASGVAAIIEIARVLANPANDFQNEYTLKFVAFGAEEAGPAYPVYHHGSKHYARNAKLNNHQLLGMISIDLIGYNDNYDYQAIATNQNSLDFAEKFLAANEEYSLGIIIEGPPFSPGTWSDHLSFQTEGYKALLMFEHAPPWHDYPPYYFKNPNLHTSYDTLGYLNMGLIKKITQLNLATFASLSVSMPLTEVENYEDVIVSDYQLFQNYPNPFNPSTKIKFNIPVADAFNASNTRLKIYDVLGNEVAIMVDEYKTPGTYEIEFNSDGLTSGVYFYKLSVGNYTETKKMLLIK